jgi:hypothetical protein
VEKRENLCTVGGNANYLDIMENSMELPQKIKNRTTIWPIDPTSVYIKEVSISNVHQSIIHHQSIHQYSFKMWHTHTHTHTHTYTHTEILFSLKREGNSTIYKIGEPQKHYAKWNKLSTERQILPYYIYMCNLKMS